MAVAGTMAVTDPVVADRAGVTDLLKYGAGIAGALLVLAAGKVIAARRVAAEPQPEAS